MGWNRERARIVDRRDYSFRGVSTLKNFKLPETPYLKAVNWIDQDTPIDNQGQVGSCTAHAGTGLLRFLQKQATGNYTKLSRLFVYYQTRSIANSSGDSGASLRDTAMELATMSAPPETYWNYNESLFDTRPTWRSSEAFLFAMAENYEGLHFVRLDPDGVDRDKVLDDIKTCVRSKLPVMFGTLVYQQIMNVNTQGDIWYPSQGEQPVGGHALLIIGYDDDRECFGTSGKGAFLIRNSWGTDWGDNGYGWLPYDYFLKGQAEDAWTCLSTKYVNIADFA